VDVRSLTCSDCGLGYRRGHGYQCLVSVVSCQIEAFASGRSLFQRNPTECGVSEYDREASIMRRPRLTSGS